MAVTMKDIARDLGIGVITVSKVLRNKDDVSEKTRKRVLARSRRLTTLQILLRAAWLRDGLTLSVLWCPIYCTPSLPR